MRPAGTFDLLTMTHYVVASIFVVFLLIDLYFLVKFLGRGKWTLSALIGASTLLVLVLAASLRMYVRENHTIHGRDHAFINLYQKSLSAYKEACGHFPTTEQGLTALSKKSEICPDFIPRKSYLGAYSYTSDGNTYEIKSVQEYNINGLLIYGTDKEPAKFFIKE